MIRKATFDVCIRSSFAYNGGVMNDINQKIIEAVIAKAEKICPDSLALIGVYGSVATGDDYEKSDLDLLILIQDDEGWKLGTGFILDDSKIGYDIYCTNWDGLRFDAECYHAHLSKLMDSQILYIKNEEAYKELCRLREQTETFLSSEERFKRVDNLIEKAKISFANACLKEEIGQVRVNACEIILSLLDAIMIYHGTYFKRGIKRTFDELAQFSLDETFLENIRKISQSKEISELRFLAKELILYVENYVVRVKQKIEPTKDSISGTYEEMHSNWRNKVEEVAVNNDTYASFVNMCCLQDMIMELEKELQIDSHNLMEAYNPDCLEENVKIFDRFLEEYEKVYQKAGMKVARYSDAEEFYNDYVENR